MKLIQTVENPWEDLPGVTIKFNLNARRDVVLAYLESNGENLDAARQVIIIEGYDGNVDELISGNVFRRWAANKGFSDAWKVVVDDPLFGMPSTPSTPPTNGEQSPSPAAEIPEEPTSTT